jgi:hypothetical protein
MNTKISTFFIAIALLLLGATTAIAQQTKVNFNKNGETVFQSTIADIDSIVFRNPEYIAIENLGGQNDFAILGLDGSGHFYEFQDENPDIPQRLSIFDGNDSTVGLIINFDEDGLPKNILSEDFTIALGNFIGNRFDAVLITKNGEIHLLENIETDISWEEYLNDLILEGSSIQRKSLWNTIKKSVVKAVNLATSAITCGTGLGLSATGLGAIVGVPLAIYGCGNTVLYSAEILDIAGVIDYESPKWVEDARNYGGNLFANCVNALNNPVLINPSVYTCVWEIIRNAADNNESSAKAAIIKGDSILLAGIIIHAENITGTVAINGNGGVLPWPITSNANIEELKADGYKTITITIYNQARATTKSLGTAYRIEVFKEHTNPPIITDIWFSKEKGINIDLNPFGGNPFKNHEFSFDVPIENFSNEFLVRFVGTGDLGLYCDIGNRTVIVIAKK